MDLTSEEIKLIEEYRKKQDLAKPKLIGYLKEDLYLCDADITCITKQAEVDQFLTKQEMEETISAIADCFELSIKAGSKFVSFTNVYGKPEWYDEIGYIEGYCNSWAEEHLENIEEYKD